MRCAVCVRLRVCAGQRRCIPPLRRSVFPSFTRDVTRPLRWVCQARAVRRWACGGGGVVVMVVLVAAGGSSGSDGGCNVE